jgi:DNA-directed RNA polymerase specialized sigma24 family protein
MSKISDLAYDIEQLYIEGYSPKTISAMLGCPIDMVYGWLEEINVLAQEAKTEPEAEDYYGA